nr:flavodoxin family protein [Prosthecochloris ethylica]
MTEKTMVECAVLSYSGYGHTRRLADAVQRGCDDVDGVMCRNVVISSDGELSAAEWELLDRSAAIVFGSPTYMGGPAWQFKKVAEASSRLWYEQRWKDKLAAGFTNSASMNGDKQVTLQYFFTFAMQHSMIWAGTALMPASTSQARRNDVNFLGSFSGLMSQSPSDASIQEAPPAGDLESGVLFGRRIGACALQWHRGR